MDYRVSVPSRGIGFIHLLVQVVVSDDGRTRFPSPLGELGLFTRENRPHLVSGV